MNYLLEILGRIGIFIVLVQTLLHFKANESYEKYIRMLTNIMILSMLIIPIISIFKKNIPQEMNRQIAFYQQQLLEIENENSIEQKIEDDRLIQDQILDAYEQEIKSKINNSSTENSYEVKEVNVTGIEADGSYDEEKLQIRIEVSEMMQNNTQKIEVDKIEISGTTNQENHLKKLYAQLLGIDEMYVEVEISE